MLLSQLTFQLSRQSDHCIEAPLMVVALVLVLVTYQAFQKLPQSKIIDNKDWTRLQVWFSSCAINSPACIHWDREVKGLLVLFLSAIPPSRSVCLLLLGWACMPSLLFYFNIVPHRLHPGSPKLYLHSLAPLTSLWKVFSGIICIGASSKVKAPSVFLFSDPSCPNHPISFLLAPPFQKALPKHFKKSRMHFL